MPSNQPAAMENCLKLAPLALISKPRFMPDDLCAKAHKTLAALDGWAQPGVGLTAKEISQITKLSVRDLGRILNRLSNSARICRSKDEGLGSGYFRYWITPKQRKSFYLQATGAIQFARINISRTLGDASLDVEMGEKLRLLTSLQDIKDKKHQLQEEARIMETEAMQVRYEIRDLRNRTSSLKLELKRMSSKVVSLRESESKLIQEKTQLSAKIEGATNHPPQRQPGKISAMTQFQMGPADLSKRLSFIMKLRERPALADLHLLQLIEKDYAIALKRATQD